MTSSIAIEVVGAAASSNDIVSTSTSIIESISRHTLCHLTDRYSRRNWTTFDRSWTELELKQEKLLSTKSNYDPAANHEQH